MSRENWPGETRLSDSTRSNPTLSVASNESSVDKVDTGASDNEVTSRSFSGASILEQTLAVLSKDFRAELRNRAALNSILLFSVTALIVVGFSVGGGELSLRAQAALLWVVLFFAAFSGLAHIFLHEEEAGTSTALRLSTDPAAVYFGKLLFNLILLFAISAIVVPLFVLMLKVQPVQPVGFALGIVFGGFGLGAAATIVAAIIGKARGKGALYGALGFPILLPLLILALYGTNESTSLSAGSGLFQALTGLTAFAVMMITASALLFPSVWEGGVTFLAS